MMPLTLSVRNAGRPGGAVPLPLRLDGRGAVIGRSPSADWVLADERNTISSRHCEIRYHDGAYVLVDGSTNGTFVNGRRLTEPYCLNEGDVIGIGPFELVAAIAAAPEATPGPVFDRTVASFSQATAAPSSSTSQSVAALAGDSPVEHLLRAAGVRRQDVRGGDREILATAGALLRGMSGALAELLKTRARAMAQMGARPTAPQQEGNPLEDPAEEALTRLLGGSGADAGAVEEALADLDAHQLALLKAMQGAMRATLERFSPDAIRQRVPGARDAAALWTAYEREFSGGGQERDDSFIEIFAREFRDAYEALAKRPPISSAIRPPS